MLSDIWSVLSHRQRCWMVCMQGLSLLLALSTVTGVASIAPFFAVLGDPGWIERSAALHRLYTYFDFQGARAFELALGMAFVAIVIGASLINILGSFAMIRLSYLISADLQSVLFGEYLHRPYAFHADTHSAALFTNVIHESNRLTKDILQNGFLLVTSGATAVLILLSVLALNPGIALAMLGVLAGGYALIYIALRNWLLYVGQMQSRLLAETTQTVNETLAAIKDILVLGVQGFFHAKFERSTRTLARAQAAAQVVYQNPRHLMECVTVAGLVSVALWSSRPQSVAGSWLAQLSFLGFAAYRLLPALQQAFAALVRIRAEQAGFAAIAPDLRQARVRQLQPTITHTSWQLRPEREILLHNLSFRYTPERSAAVEGLCLRIPAHAAVGLVGANGSGKTSVVDLISGLLEPTAGHIEVDGIVLQAANRSAWQARIAYVTQSLYLLDASIADNIALGVTATSIDAPRLQHAVTRAQLDPLLASLPGGIHYRVGERGSRLSGGQRQRIGIARALYRDATVLIMDEATNALDGLSERELVSTVLKLRGSCTLIMIAHHLQTVQACDFLIQLERGRVVASGSYSQLLASASFRQLMAVS